MEEIKMASKAQTWALYCITHKDYRDKNLTYDEADALIKKLSKDKKGQDKHKQLEKELVDYFKEKALPKVVASLKGCLGIKSEVVEDTSMMKGTGKDGEAKHYSFRGCGCSVSYFTYNKNSKKAVELVEIFREHHYKDFREMVEKQFPLKLRRQLEKEGTPLGALYCQDYDVNHTLYSMMVEFAHSKGLKSFNYVTRID